MNMQYHKEFQILSFETVCIQYENEFEKESR